MPARLPIPDPSDPRVDEYRGLSDPSFLRARGLFVAEGRLVVRRLLDHGGYRVRSMLLTEAARAGLEDALARVAVDAAVYTVSLDTMRAVTGFNIHRGCLAIVERPPLVSVAGVLAGAIDAHLIVVLEDVANADNIGGVFRNALAFGAGAVLLSPRCCDPLYRKAIRTSMAASLRVPFAHVTDWPEGLTAVHAAGFSLVALTPASTALDIREFASDPARGKRVALVAGTEGGGLSVAVETLADHRVRIPMARGADSLNLATATGIALQRLSDPA